MAYTQNYKIWKVAEKNITHIMERKIIQWQQEYTSNRCDKEKSILK